MLKISYANSPGLSSSEFTLEMCAAAKNCEKFTKNPYFESLRSFKIIDVNKSKKRVTSACYNKRHVCTYLQPFSRCTSQ